MTTPVTPNTGTIACVADHIEFFRISVPFVTALIGAGLGYLAGRHNVFLKHRLERQDRDFQRYRAVLDFLRKIEEGYGVVERGDSDLYIEDRREARKQANSIESDHPFRANVLVLLDRIDESDVAITDEQLGEITKELQHRTGCTQIFPRRDSAG